MAGLGGADLLQSGDVVVAEAQSLEVFGGELGEALPVEFRFQMLGRQGAV